VVHTVRTTLRPNECDPGDDAENQDQQEDECRGSPRARVGTKESPNLLGPSIAISMRLQATAHNSSPIPVSYLCRESLLGTTLKWIINYSTWLSRVEGIGEGKGFSFRFPHPWSTPPVLRDCNLLPIRQQRQVRDPRFLSCETSSIRFVAGLRFVRAAVFRVDHQRDPVQE
jgi:hypothetical protein